MKFLKKKSAQVPTVPDLIITTDSNIFYYGTRSCFANGGWVEITAPVVVDDMNYPEYADRINSMMYLVFRKRKRFLLDPIFFRRK